jgi:hypothetical protein
MRYITKLFQNKFWLFILLFIFVRGSLINFNYAEWGDTYRIKDSTFELYPSDEKRPPLLSALLATYPRIEFPYFESFSSKIFLKNPGSGNLMLQPIFYGRIILFLFSFASFIVFLNYFKYLKFNLYQQFLAVVLFIFNPVYLYWSLRVYADIPFVFFVLLSFLLLLKYKENLAINFLIGILAGLSILLRFEGYLLFGSLGLGLVFYNLNFLSRIKNGIIYSLGFLSVAVPYWFYRNPLTSSYFEEPAGRTYDFNMFIIYTASLIFVLGITPALYFIIKGFKNYNIGLTVFILLELLLVLSWPAAVPRLFLPIIPFLILFAANYLGKLLSNNNFDFKAVGFSFLSVGLLLGFQFIYRLQFLVLNKPVLVLVLLLGILTGAFMLVNKSKLVVFVLVTQIILFSFSTLYIHQDIFKVITKANDYARSNLEGKIGYNDVSAVSGWYLNYEHLLLGIPNKVSGEFYNLTQKSNREYESASQYNYFIVTNEHNLDMEVDFSPWPHLIEVKQFTHEINSGSFFTKIIKLKML